DPSSRICTSGRRGGALVPALSTRDRIGSGNRARQFPRTPVRRGVVQLNSCLSTRQSSPEILYQNIYFGVDKSITRSLYYGRHSKGDCTVDAREQRGLIIAATCRITKRGSEYSVPSQAQDGTRYTVRPSTRHPRCSCPDFETRHLKCKHIYAVEYVIKRE